MFSETESRRERKVVLFMHLSLDGFAAGPNGELDWISYDNDLEKYAEGMVSTAGAAIYGRTTYELMKNYWPTVLTSSSATKHEIDHANWVENVQKIVFSKTLDKADWNNTTLIKKDIKKEVIKLKQQSNLQAEEYEKKLMIFGSPGISKTFMKLDLIDEYQLTVNPVILGKGIPVFKNNIARSNLKLLNSTTFNSGVIALHYERI